MIIFRIDHSHPDQGLWYNHRGEHVNFIEKKFSFCRAAKLQMPFNASLVGWKSGTFSLEELFEWFNIDEIKRLQEHGYCLTVWDAPDVREHEGHAVFLQKTAMLIGRMKLE